jgi:hypothetical protein
MQLQNLVYIAIILFLLYTIYNKSSEHFSGVNNKKDCSQKAIDDGYISYIFGIPYFVRSG